ncbi:MAG: succinylglutamate desuccinylase/aspartoacylase family protein [Candidatus Sumerlaeia bacterium]|nr:succinylglutamate desuccinylase/aspartoacylase family protein [Candidatus Sumerlaeia bacterium]
MPRAKRFEIAGRVIAPGESADVQLDFSESYLGRAVSIPIRVIRAKKDGPRLFFTGAVHGDELTGIGIIRELLYGEPPKLKCGTLVCVPVVNIFGLENHSRYLPDRRDLNRSFPGIQTGSMTSRVASAVYREIISLCDMGVDFHSAAVRRTNYPNVRADMRNVAIRKMARAFGCELIVNSKGPEGSLRREACKANIPTIILEAGEVWKSEPGVVEAGMRGCLNLLKSLDMIDGDLVPPLFQVTVEKTTWVRAQRGGFLGFHARPGDLVEEGDTLATNYSIFGREQNNLTSPITGIVLGMTTMPAVKPGEPVYHVARLSEPTYRRIKRTIERSPAGGAYKRLRRDLATNIRLES